MSPGRISSSAEIIDLSNILKYSDSRVFDFSMCPLLMHSVNRMSLFSRFVVLIIVDLEMASVYC